MGERREGREVIDQYYLNFKFGLCVGYGAVRTHGQKIDPDASPYGNTFSRRKKIIDHRFLYSTRKARKKNKFKTKERHETPSN